MRSTLRGPLGWALAAGLVLAACNVTGTTGATNAPKASGPRVGSFDRPISLAFTPSQQAATIATNGAAIKSALERSTGLAWKVTTMTSYAAQVEAMCSGSVDVGFFAPLQMTLLLSKTCGTPVIGALRKDDTGALSTTYKSQILVKADSGINDISGLKGKKFAFVDPLSASGFVYPTLAIKNKTGQEPKTFFSSTIFAGGHPQAALAVYQGTVDGAATFIDARDSLVATIPDLKLPPRSCLMRYWRATPCRARERKSSLDFRSCASKYNNNVCNVYVTDQKMPFLRKIGNKLLDF